MFCKKCGNPLKDNAKFCPKCGAQQTVKPVSPPEPPPHYPDPPAKPETTTPAPPAKASKGGNTGKKIAILLFILAGLGLLILLSYFFIFSSNSKENEEREYSPVDTIKLDTPDLSDESSIDEEKVSEVVKEVDSRLKALSDDPSFQNADLPEKRTRIEAEMEKMVDEGYVVDGSLVYDENSNSYVFEYQDGGKGAIDLNPREQDDQPVAGYSTEYSNNSGSVRFSPDVKAPEGTNFLCAYALGTTGSFSYVNDCYTKLINNWTAEGVNVTLKRNQTVADMRTLMNGDYDYINISMHGTFIDNSPAVCLDEAVTTDSILSYLTDILSERIYPLIDMENGDAFYALMPSFFTYYYGNDGLDNSIVHLSCCMGYYNDKLVSAFEQTGADSVTAYTNSVYCIYDCLSQDAYVNQLLSGKTVEESVDFAQKTWGADDNTFYKEQFGEKSNKGAAIMKIRTGEDEQLNDD